MSRIVPLPPFDLPAATCAAPAAAFISTVDAAHAAAAMSAIFISAFVSAITADFVEFSFVSRNIMYIYYQ